MSTTKSIENALDAAERLNPQLNSFLSIEREHALARADQLKDNETTLDGLAIAVKLTPGLLAPAVLRRRGLLVAACTTGTVALSYLPHVLAVGTDVLGYIPGSMTAPGYLVLGAGDARSLHSASHGAGRKMSRKKAKESTRWSHVRDLLDNAGVRLLSAGLDEAPIAYKNIDEVMAAQADLVRPIARFQPRLVKMAGEGEPAED